MPPSSMFWLSVSLIPASRIIDDKKEYKVDARW